MLYFGGFSKEGMKKREATLVLIEKAIMWHHKSLRSSDSKGQDVLGLRDHFHFTTVCENEVYIKFELKALKPSCELVELALCIIRSQGRCVVLYGPEVLPSLILGEQSFHDTR